MRRLHATALLALTLTFAPTALAADADQMAQLDKDLKDVAAFEHGKDAGPLARVEDVVMAVAKDPKARDAVEQRLLGVLGSTATIDAKMFICRQLRTIGTARSVPQLSALLTDPRLSHMARYALGRIEDPAAVQALHGALAKTSGKVQVGIINTLGDRRCEKAVPDLARLLTSVDRAVAEAAAGALGRIGGSGVVTVLEAARPRATEPLRRCIDDALLVCADHLLVAGRKAEAARIYETFYAPTMPRHVRIGALRGLVAAREAAAAPLLAQAIKSPDRQMQTSAIAFARILTGTQATRMFVDLLPSLPPDTQELLVRALAARGDPTAAPAIVTVTRSESEAVRVAALEALGVLGDASSIGLLAQAAATAGGTEQKVAQASLVRLPGDAINRAILRAAGSGDPQVRIELIRALAGRRAREAAADLLKIARDDEPSVRREAILALGAVADEARLDALVALAVKPKDPGDRAAAEEAVASALRRVEDPDRRAAPVLAALAGAPSDAKAVLLRLLGKAATPKAFKALSAAVKDPNEAVQDAAVRTLSEWPDPAAAETLLQLARTAAKPAHKVLALRGYVRLAAQTKNPTAMYVRAMQLAERPDDKKLVLGGLGGADSADALTLVERYLTDERLQTEAGAAAVQIADRLRQSDPTRARAAVKKVVASVKDPRVRAKAQEVINEMDQYEGYILQWLVAGPYEEKGKEASQLFDVAFPPERSGATGVTWKPLTRGIGSWDITLDAAVGGGEDRAAYMRTSVVSPADQDVRLELGSDDSIKVWLNGKVVHANNTDRGISPRQDLVKATLKKGANDLLIRVINHSGGWGFACRIRSPDGAALDGLKVEAKP